MSRRLPTSEVAIVLDVVLDLGPDRIPLDRPLGHRKRAGRYVLERRRLVDVRDTDGQRARPGLALGGSHGHGYAVLEPGEGEGEVLVVEARGRDLIGNWSRFSFHENYTNMLYWKLCTINNVIIDYPERRVGRVNRARARRDEGESGAVRGHGGDGSDAEGEAACLSELCALCGHRREGQAK